MIKTLSLMSVALLLAACAATPPASDAGSTVAAAPAEKATILRTGSRIPDRSTDRLLRTIGSETFKNDDGSQIKSLSNITGGRSN